MELSNFGAVLTFAAELEAEDSRFYTSTMKNPVVNEFRSAFEEIVAVLGRNEKDLLRARRENVTEMILEPIQDFSAKRFCCDRSGAAENSAGSVLDKAVAIEANAVKFYAVAAEKMHALPEVRRLLTKMGKIRSGNRMKLENLLR
jgi:rubrerythrin